MLPFKTLLVIDRNSEIAVYRQLANQMVSLINKGTLLPNMELPSTRSLALSLGLHRKTIMAAYNDLVAEDWLESVERKGYKVSGHLPAIRPRSYTARSHAGYSGKAAFDFARLDNVPLLPRASTGAKVIVDDGFPEKSIFPIESVSKEYKKLMYQSISDSQAQMGDIGGSAYFKECLSVFLNDTRGLNILTTNLLVTRGAQMAIYIAASLIIKPGDKIIVSDPSYFIADATFLHLGAELIRIPMDQEGMQIDAIEEVLKENKIKLLYIIPHHHHPTTTTLSPQRRSRLLALIKENNLPVIEDDYDYDFQYQQEPYLPLASGDHGGNIIYIGSLTKVLGTNYRLGYMIATNDFLNNALKLKSLIDLRGDMLMEGTIASLLQSGDLARFISKANRLYESRCNYAYELIKNELTDVVDFVKPQGGMALWLKFKDAYPLSNILTKASSFGLEMTGSAYHLGDNAKHNAIRFGYASINEQQMDFAVNIIKKITGA